MDDNELLYVERQVVQLLPDGVREDRRANPNGASAAPQPLASLRDLHAWVLLGEPGAGKTRTFKEEADKCGGCYVEVGDFVLDGILDDWKDTCLFLDALDEERDTLSGRELIRKIKGRLIELGRPPYRLACRAADWRGESDLSKLKEITPSKPVHLFALEPISTNDVTTIACAQLGEVNGLQFLDQATQAGVGALLNNPQMLEMFLKGYQKNGHFPTSREQALDQGCELLAEESNKNYRDKTRLKHRPSTSDIQYAAGKIFATLLFSNQGGIALDRDAQSKRFTTVNDLGLSDDDAANCAITTKLFAVEDSERVRPVHRSVAEYLGAKWLAQQIDVGELTLNRLKGLLCGFDGQAMNDLRGLYGWLATFSLKARDELIRKDPVAVALYGDLEHMAEQSQMLLWNELRMTIERQPAFASELRQAKNLAPALIKNPFSGQLLAVLSNANREQPTQTFIACLLHLLAAAPKVNGAVADELVGALKNVILDSSWDIYVRDNALDVWLKFKDNRQHAIELLNRIYNHSDIGDDQLITGLLRHLFLNNSDSIQALNFLRPTEGTWDSSYLYFWGFEFPNSIPSGSLIDTLNRLVQLDGVEQLIHGNYFLENMVAGLVERALDAHGETVSPETLHRWLSLDSEKGSDPIWCRITTEKNNIAVWLNSHSALYFDLLDECYKQSESKPDPGSALRLLSNYLRFLHEPMDIGAWHLQQLKKPHSEWRIRDHLAKAAQSALNKNRTNPVPLNALQEWAGNDPVKLAWLEPLIHSPPSYELPGWAELKAQEQAHQTKRRQEKHERSNKLGDLIPEIEAGIASPGVMRTLAVVWLGLARGIKGTTPLQRFADYCENYELVYPVTESGFIACIHRVDLPIAKEIFQVFTQGLVNPLGKPVLIGAHLLWSSQPMKFERLSDETDERLVAFWLVNRTEGNLDGMTEWLDSLLTRKPDLVAEVIVRYVQALLKISNSALQIEWLLVDKRFENIKLAIAIGVLKKLPTRLSSTHLSMLGQFLAFGLEQNNPDLQALILKKCQVETLGHQQMVYWLCAATLMDPIAHEPQLWRYVANNRPRLEALSSALYYLHDHNSAAKRYPIPTVGRFIEHLAPYGDLDWIGTVREPVVNEIGVYGSVITHRSEIGKQVLSLIGRLANTFSNESLNELKRLLTLEFVQATPTLLYRLQATLHETNNELREREVRDRTVTDVVKVLTKGQPTSAADLQALVIDHLDQLATEIRSDDSNMHEQFYQDKEGLRHKNEPTCRNALLAMIKPRLKYLSAGVNKEVSKYDDKRVDIEVSFEDRFKLPIEIKGQWHDKLWTAMNDQVPQYTRDTKTDGYAIYLVLWFGGHKQRKTGDGGKKPTSPEELQKRLQAQVDQDKQHLVIVRVLDVSWPKGQVGTPPELALTSTTS